MLPENISNILGQETIKKIYEDGASEPTKEVCKILVDVVRTFRLFTAPFQLAAAYQGKFEKYLEKVRNSVPEENQIECPASLAVPVFEKLKYLEEDNYLKDLYLNLLTRAIDKDRVNEAHPAFITIIEQLSPDEALILKILAENNIRFEVISDTVVEIGSTVKEQMVENNFPTGSLVFPQDFQMYLSHLNYLNLIDMPQYNIGEPDTTKENNPVKIYRMARLSEFGTLFYNACIKE